MTKLKPIVNYDESKGFYVKKGDSAFVWPMNHPNPHGLVSNTKKVHTSMVINIINDDPNGPVFETENTLYYPTEK